MNFGIYAGDTNKTIYVRLRDSTTGLAKTGLVYNSAGAVCSYVLPLAARAAITLATQTVTGAHADGGFVEVDATNCKGLYRLDLPDAAIASGDYTLVSIEFDGVIEETIVIPLHTQKVNTIEVSGTTQTANDNGLDINAILVDTNSLNDTKIPQTLNLTASGNIGIDWANVENPTTVLDLSATDINLVDTTTTNTDMRGTDNAALASVCTETRLSELDAATAGKAANQIDIIQTDTTTDIPALIATAQADLDTITGSDGVTLATAQGNMSAFADLYGNIHTDINISSATASTVVFNSGDMVGVDDYYNGMVVYIYGGTGIGQARKITDYVGATKTATIYPNWGNNPDNTADAMIFPFAVAEDVAGIVDAVWDETLAGHVTADTTGLLLNEWQDGGRLDLILDARMAEASINTTGGAVDVVTLVTTTTTNTDMVAEAPAASVIADAVWDEAATGHTDAGKAGQQLWTDLDAVLADTNELQGDWADAGRLDAILDARASQTTADAIETDTQDIQARLPAALVSGRIDADMGAISTSTDAADKLEASAETMETGAATSTTLSTTQMSTNLTEATDDHYNGRVIIWTSGALLRQATNITDYNGTTKTLTFTAVTEAPADTDTFIIV